MSDIHDRAQQVIAGTDPWLDPPIDNGSVNCVEVVVAHRERATIRVGELFLKVDVDEARSRREVEAMALAPVPTPAVRWHVPPVLAVEALPGAPIGRLGEASSASAAAWTAAGAVLRKLHDAPLPPWTGPSVDAMTAELDAECAWLGRNSGLTGDVITRNRRIADAALRPCAPAFIHGDLQANHVFVSGDVITGVIDWSEAQQGDPLYDVATLTLGHPERLADVEAGYGRAVDPGVIRGWWSLRSLRNARWLINHGFDPAAPGCEFDVLRTA